MAAGPITPVPFGDIKTMPLGYQMWYQRIRDYTNSLATGTIPWTQVDKAGSSIVDLASRDHNNLTNIFGGGTSDYYHITGSQQASISALTTISSLTTLNTTHGFVLCDASSGAFTVNLPAASSRKKYHIKKIDSSINAITISANGADTIEGSASKSLATQYKSYTIYSDGSSTWYIESAT